MRYLLLLVILPLPYPGFAQQATVAWLQPEVLEAALAIGLMEDQMPRFRDSVTKLVNDRNKATNKLLRRHNVSGLEREINSITRRQFKKMDERMAAFLTEEQYPKYETYRGLLRESMTDGIRSSSDAEMGDANSALRAISNHH